MKAHFLFLSFVTFLLVGCDSTVEPVRQDTFSIYGYLSVSADTQFVRVKPLDQPVGQAPTDKLEAAVMLHNRSTGDTYTLRDSVVTFVDKGDSVQTHNYWTGASISPGTTYEISVKKNGKIVTSASTTTPTDRKPSVSPDSGNCRTRFRLQFDEALQLPFRFKGSFRYDGELYTLPLDRDSLTEARNPVESAPYIVIKPDGDLLSKRIPKKEQPPPATPFDNRYVPRCLDLDDTTLTFQYVLVSQDWGAHSPDSSTLAGPIRFVEHTEVENGHGFLGSLQRGHVSVRVDTADTLGSITGSATRPADSY